MSVIARYLLIAGVLFGVAGTGTYINDVRNSGEGLLQSPSGPAGTCLGIGLALVGLGLHLLMRDSMRLWRK
jgi:hypothetical protein